MNRKIHFHHLMCRIHDDKSVEYLHGDEWKPSPKGATIFDDLDAFREKEKEVEATDPNYTFVVTTDDPENPTAMVPKPVLKMFQNEDGTRMTEADRERLREKNFQEAARKDRFMSIPRIEFGLELFREGESAPSFSLRATLPLPRYEKGDIFSGAYLPGSDEDSLWEVENVVHELRNPDQHSNQMVQQVFLAPL